jgi:GntR family colanic acid and biofilm gene transcriptional regulator
MGEFAPPKRGRGRVQLTAPALTPVDTGLPEPVERQVYRSIRLGLMSGLIAPGATLTSRSLALQLKVSVQPVRDALKRLEADGVLDGRPQSGFFLRDPTASEYRELTEIRQRLEGLAGSIAAISISDDLIDQLRRINEGMGKIDRQQLYLAENYRFHFAIYSQAGRPSLLAMIETLWMRIGPSLHHYPSAIDRVAILEKHNAIIDGLARRDGAATEAAIAYDLGVAADLIVPHLSPG